jgi:competence protein ComEC
VIIFVAVTYWMILWVTALPGSSSQIKLSYPRIEFIEGLRAVFLFRAQGVSPDAKALVGGLAIGERELLSPEMAENMKTLSLTHLVAVSGANLAIIMGVVYLLTATFGLARNTRFTSALLVMVAYVLVVGPESSVLRSATMATFVALGLWLGRGAKPLISLAWAVIFLLAVDPGLATDFGFALSALATVGLLTMAVPIYKWLSGFMPRLIAIGIAASFSAQLTTTPVLLMLQPSIPIYSVLANLIVEPVVAPVTILGILALILAYPLPFLSSAVSYLASIGTWWITLVANEVSAWPAARVHFVAGPAGIVLAALIVLLCLGVYQPRLAKYRVGLAASLAGVLLLSAAWSTIDQIRFQGFDGEWEVVNCDVGQGDALVIRSQGVIALIDVGRKPDPVRECLDNLKVTQIDLLVITHFDADHAGGIYGALDGRKVKTAVISGFADDRPLVSLVASALAQSRVKVLTGFAGMGGKLGELNWKVLAPTAKATEAKDSNDASVIVAFTGEKYGVLALGDLGAAGQTRLMRSAGGALSELAHSPLLLKVAHHGSADQSSQLFEMLSADVAIFSVGQNPYGHPTKKALDQATLSGAIVVRTDELGSVAFRFEEQSWKISSAGKLTA